MKRLGYKYHLVSIMMIISLICIGFSSWNITNQIGGQSLTGSIKADNVINSSEYIEFNQKDHGPDDYITAFQYCDIGFVDGNNLISAGRVTVHYRLKANACRDLLTQSSNNAIKIECTLSGTDGTSPLAVFTTISGKREVKGEVEYDTSQVVKIANENISSTQTSSTYSFTIGDILETSGDEHTISIAFKFEVAPGKNFTDNFYNKLGTPEFTVSTRISGVTV